jgi:hypothetical protein
VPTTKDFTEEGGPVKIGQPPRLSAPNRPEQRRDKLDSLLLYQRDHVLNDGARLIRVVRCVGDDRGAIRARQLERILQMFRVRRIERSAGNVAISGRVHSRIKIGQPHIDPKVRQTAAEGAVTAAWIERNSRHIKP